MLLLLDMTEDAPKPVETQAPKLVRIVLNRPFRPGRELDARRGFFGKNVSIGGEKFNWSSTVISQPNETVASVRVNTTYHDRKNGKPFTENPVAGRTIDVSKGKHKVKIPGRGTIFIRVK